LNYSYIVNYIVKTLVSMYLVYDVSFIFASNLTYVLILAHTELLIWLKGDCIKIKITSQKRTQVLISIDKEVSLFVSFCRNLTALPPEKYIFTFLVAN